MSNTQGPLFVFGIPFLQMLGWAAPISPGWEAILSMLAWPLLGTCRYRSKTCPWLENRFMPLRHFPRNQLKSSLELETH